MNTSKSKDTSKLAAFYQTKVKEEFSKKGRVSKFFARPGLYKEAISLYCKNPSQQGRKLLDLIRSELSISVDSVLNSYWKVPYQEAVSVFSGTPTQQSKKILELIRKGFYISAKDVEFYWKMQYQQAVSKYCKEPTPQNKKILNLFISSLYISEDYAGKLAEDPFLTHISNSLSTIKLMGLNKQTIQPYLKLILDLHLKPKEAGICIFFLIIHLVGSELFNKTIIEPRTYDQITQLRKLFELERADIDNIDSEFFKVLEVPLRAWYVLNTYREPPVVPFKVYEGEVFFYGLDNISGRIAGAGGSYKECDGNLYFAGDRFIFRGQYRNGKSIFKSIDYRDVEDLVPYFHQHDPPEPQKKKSFESFIKARIDFGDSSFNNNRIDVKIINRVNPFTFISEEIRIAYAILKNKARL